MTGRQDTGGEGLLTAREKKTTCTPVHNQKKKKELKMDVFQVVWAFAVLASRTPTAGQVMAVNPGIGLRRLVLGRCVRRYLPGLQVMAWGVRCNGAVAADRRSA
jgi:hypothetical protein